MNTKNAIRVTVLAALLAWPGVETCRYFIAKQQLAASLEQQRTIQIELARLESLQFASQKTPAIKP